MAAIGRLPDTLADRCILIRMQRKTQAEKCERFRTLQAHEFKRKCARFVQDHAQAIAAATPELPPELNDRAADIWEPLFALADLAGGHWPARARDAALALNSQAQETNPITSLLGDLAIVFTSSERDCLFSCHLVEFLNRVGPSRPWYPLTKGKGVTELWLSQQLSTYDIRPRILRIGDDRKRGYELNDFWEPLKRYVPNSYQQLKEKATSHGQDAAPTGPAQSMNKESIPLTPKTGDCVASRQTNNGSVHAVAPGPVAG
jgi:hypothetical protein